MSFWKELFGIQEPPPMPVWRDAPESLASARAELNVKVPKLPPSRTGDMHFKLVGVEEIQRDIERKLARQRACFRDEVRVILRERFHGDRQAFYTAAGLDRRLFSKIVSYAGYNPSKETALAIAVGARLSVSEARALLRVAGFDWTDASIADVVYQACLRHHVYEWEHIRELLKQYGTR